MADAYRYPLTRICLRTGSLTLPLTLLGVFPERDDLVAYDPEKDAEFALRVEGRSVTGLAPFFAAHDLDVNDELSIRPLEDGRFAFTAIVRPKRPDYTRPDVLGKLLDAVVETGVPMSEAEIRAMHGDLPSGFPLRQALEREPRLALVDGRWRLASEPQVAEPQVAEPQVAAPQVAEPARAAPEVVRVERAARVEPAAAEREPARTADRAAAPPATRAEAAPGPRSEATPAPHVEATSAPRADRADTGSLPSVEEAAERRLRARQSQEDSAARAEVEAALEAQAAREAEILELVRREELEGQFGSDASEAEASSIDDGLGEDAVELEPAAERRRSRERLAQHAEDDVRQAARDRRREGADEGQESFGWDLPTPRGFRFPWSRKAPAKTTPAKPEPVVSSDPFRLDRLGEPRPVERNAPPATRVTPSPRAGLFAEGAALNSATLPPGDPAKTKKARESFARLGYRVEGLAHGQLMLHADLGRRQERVLVHVLPDGQRLDWAALLARRREAGAQQLAVVGDHRDLHRLVSPAELAKATLWSWAGVERVVALSADLPIGPFDLEAHFERDGLFEYGLERFERSVARRVQERGTFSTVLERLAALKAPSVFVLDDLVGGGDVPRDQALRVLERLGEAPLHLVSRVDSGEFCLRYRVHDALDGLAAYATSLRARLPERQRARVRGVDGGVDPIGAEELEGAVAPGAPTVQAFEVGPDLEPTTPTSAELELGGERERERELAGERELAPVPVRAVPKVERAQRLPFAGPGLGDGDDEEDADAVDMSLVATKRNRGPKR